MLIRLNKPFDVLCQFSNGENRQTLADFVPVTSVYPAGRLDRDSEGLVLLTDDGGLQHHISHPQHKLPKTYWAQVEGKPDPQAIAELRTSVSLKDGRTAPAKARLIAEPPLWPRTPPIRHRAHIPTHWMELTLHEGRNRQVRRMTAAIGHPTLRLVRYRIGPWSLDGLAPGQWQETKIPEEWATIASHEEMDTPRHRGRNRGKQRSVSGGGRNQKRHRDHKPAGRTP